MGTEEYFPCMKINKMFYFRHLEYFWAQNIYVWCPSQIIVNSYSQHSVVLYIFNDVAFRGQKGGGGGGNKALYFFPFLSCGY